LARRTRNFVIGRFAVPATAGRGTRRLIVRVVSATGVALVVTALLPAVSQAAQPKTVAEAQAQLDDLDNQAEAASEQVNEAKILLSQAQDAATASAATASRAHDAVLAEQAKVGALAAESYKAGGLSQGLAIVLSTTDPSQTMTRIATLQQLSSQQSTTLVGARSADQRYAEAVASAAQAKATAARFAAQLAQKQAQITAALAKSKQVLARLSATQRAQLLAAQKAKAAAEQARAAAALASYQRSVAVSKAAAAAQAASRSLDRKAAAARAVTVALPQSSRGSSVAQRAVAAAMSKLGHRYVFGAAGANTFDCSGLVEWAYGQAGVGTAHYTGTLWNSYRHVPQSQLKPGDLVFFYRDHHHVGIYIGNGLMINAPHTGDVVKIASISGHGSYSGAVRVVG
jgi:peptidoglycan DL-endopeptidase CwlO